MTEDELLLEQLYRMSGILTAEPDSSSYALVSRSLFHCDQEVRERAVFIGGLRWADPLILGCFIGIITVGMEPVDDNRRLMVESLVSAALRGRLDAISIGSWLGTVIGSSDLNSLQAKAAYIGLLRIKGRISTAEFACLDYDDVVVDSSTIS
ncbi:MULTISPECIES: hypothetical protein [Bacteria]|uniref:hypothetical protein n=1 Tax=Bacteria TaxID=2 RepID=UPI0012AF44FE|nr:MULTISPECIES: hypothetical protein [Bacteria]ELC7364702.1 hypothetical protein [Stenotrophomonas maltophilia]MBH1632222.1 hypothetical protein [Stenotrophomonas maltophilia]MCU1142931.1 hypothetical protein [Stenotrophomonas maltophilia]QGL91849.1 hypothetical protein FEO92_05490 [Stenotrophomonas maltophilia]HEL4149252.1 hypothetical protein [Stenotrophomonas maltophilia]